MQVGQSTGRQAAASGRELKERLPFAHRHLHQHVHQAEETRAGRKNKRYFKLLCQSDVSNPHAAHTQGVSIPTQTIQTRPIHRRLKI